MGAEYPQLYPLYRLSIHQYYYIKYVVPLWLLGS